MVSAETALIENTEDHAEQLQLRPTRDSQLEKLVRSLEPLPEERSIPKPRLRAPLRREPFSFD